MNLPDKTTRVLGTLLTTICFAMLAAYSVMPGPFWKYGSYSLLCVTGIVGLFVAVIESRGRRLMGGLVLVASLFLGYATHDSRQRRTQRMEQFRKEAESRMMEELKKVPPPSNQ